MPTADALAAARARDLDLVEVAAGAVPPVCRLLDYGKYKYEQQKKDKQGKHQHGGNLHEVRFKVKISDHDLGLKLRRAEQFLKDGGKVKLSVMFRGREILHREIGQQLLERAHEKLQEVAVVEKPATMEGRFMNMILGPVSAQKRQQKEAEPPKAAAAAEG
jgi:translation initiation factor IF-3